MVWRAVDRRLRTLYCHRPFLILATAELAAGKNVPPPPELVVLWDWRDLNTPKVHGGLDDQPAGLLPRARYLEAVYNVMQTWYKHGGQSFNERDLRVFRYVLELRKQYAHAR